MDSREWMVTEVMPMANKKEVLWVSLFKTKREALAYIEANTGEGIITLYEKTLGNKDRGRFVKVK